MYSPQISQDHRSSKDQLATSATSATSKSQAVLGEFDRLRERRVPGDNLDSGDRSEISGEEHVAIMEKDLRDDAPWKRIQRNTFTRWVNEHLKKAKESIESLQADLSDGLRLITLIEVLSGKKLPKHTKRPTFRSQKLENVSVALTFLEDEEGIKLVSIDSADIVDGRLKLILGLIWALILHYSISLPKWGDEESEKEKKSPKERLLSWFSNKLPVGVKNFTVDWNDGRACGALDNAIAPGLCPDWESWDPKNALWNATEAMALAEKWLGIPQLIRPEDMIDPNMDEQSMMTYLAQFPVAKLKPGAPIRSKSVGDAKMVQCTGRGLQQNGIRVGERVFIRICTKTSGEGSLIVTITGPNHLPVPLQTKKISTGLYEYSYAPSLPGRHVVEIMFGERPVISSPFTVNVGLPWDSKIRAFGPGLSGGAVGYSADFNVNMAGEPGMLGFSIEGPSQVDIECKDRGDLVASVKYWPTIVGEYAVHVLCGEEDIPGSPFMADVVDLPHSLNPSKVTFEFLKSERSGEALPEVSIAVDTRSAGNQQDLLKLSVMDGAYRDVVVMEKETSCGLHTFTFTPEDTSPHVVQITYGGVAVPGSPMKVPMSELKKQELLVTSARTSQDLSGKCDVSAIKMDGLDTKVFTNRMIEFSVDARSVVGKLDGEVRAVLTSPSGISTEALVSRKSAGQYVVTYSVFEEGVYTLDVSYEGSRVPGSPFTFVAMRSTPPPPSVKTNGAQVIESSTQVSQITEDGATVVTHRRETRVTSQVLTSSSHHVFTEELGDCALVEATTGTSDGRSLAGPCCDVSKVVASGSGLEKASCSKANTFMVKADAAGYNMLLVGIYGKILHAHEVQVKHLGHANYQVTYTLKERGEYLLSVKYGDVPIPGSPFVINCL